MALTLRRVKGARLTHDEMDDNWAGLADGSLITGGGSAGLSGSGGSALVGFVQSGSAPIATTVQAYLRSKKILLGWIPTSLWAGIAAGTDTTDLSTYIANAATDCAGAAIYVPAGRYLANALALPSNTHLYGDGEASIFRPYDTTLKGVLGCESSSSSTYITGLKFRKLKFLGTVASEGHSQFAGLLALAGVKRCRIEDCFFEGSRGDGVTVFGTKQDGSGERHNYDIVVRGCTFDGLGNENRNAISVTDVDGMAIDGNDFVDYTKSTMPGSIVIEPDIAASVIKNVRVTNNTFSGGAGTGGYVTVSCGSSVNLSNVVVSNNTFNGFTAVKLDCSATSPTEPHNILVSNNVAKDCSYFFRHVNGHVWGCKIDNNISHASASSNQAVIFGTNTSTRTNKDIAITNNDFTIVGTICVILYNNLDMVQVSGNTMRGATSAHIRVGGTGAGESSSYVSIHDNAFFGTPSSGIVLHQSGTKNPLTNTYYRNYAPTTVTHNFSATMTDFCGSVTDAYDETANPDTFPYGEHLSNVDASSIIGSGTDYGMLITRRGSSTGFASMYQLFKPSTSADDTRIMMRRATAATTWGNWYQIGGNLSGSATYDPPSLVDGAGATTTVTVTGAALGDFAEASFSLDLQGITLTAWVSAANTVSVRFQNETTGTLDLASGTLRARVRKA